MHQKPIRIVPATPTAVKIATQSGHDISFSTPQGVHMTSFLRP